MLAVYVLRMQVPSSLNVRGDLGLVVPCETCTMTTSRSPRDLRLLADRRI